VPFIQDKLNRFFTGDSSASTAEDEPLCVRTDAFTDLVWDLYRHGDFNRMEQENIFILPLRETDSFCAQSLYNAKNLGQWKELVSANELVETLANNWLTTHFQPIVRAGTSDIYGYECLTRGLMPDGELIEPSELFGKAGRTDLLFNLDKLARQTTIQSITDHLPPGKKAFINFVPTAIYNPDNCLHSTIEAIHEKGLVPGDVVFEVVEFEKIGDMDHLRSIMDHYRSKGFSVALDDLGSGFASLNLLTKLHPDYVKIDMELIRSVDSDSLKRSIVEAIIRLSREQNILVIAEGVETREELAYVTEAGVDFVQGFIMGRPAPVPQAVIPVNE